MLPLLRTAILAALCAVPALAQTGAQLKKDLATKEAAAKKDPEAMFEVGKWATEKALVNDAKRIYQAVLKLKPEHAGAHEALGDELVEGKWLPAKEAEAARKKAIAAEYAAKGFVEVEGVWVEKDKVADAKRGIFQHEGEAVTKDEMLAFMAGKVRHPETGQLIDQKHLEKAKGGYYPVGGEGRWVDQKEADTFHSDFKRPWIVRTSHCVIMSTLPLAKIEPLKLEVDTAFEKVGALIGHRVLLPKHRPVTMCAATTSEYQEISTDLGDGTDSAGVFILREEATIKVEPLGEQRIAIFVNEKDWAPRYARHAAAMAYAHNAATEAGFDAPLWLLHGIGSYTSRFDTEYYAGAFGKAHQGRGGVKNLKGFFSSFAISGEMESAAIAYNIYQAGLLVHYAAHGGDAKVTEAMQAVTACFTRDAQSKPFEKALTQLQSALIEAEPKIAAYLQGLIAKGPQ